MDKCLRSMKEWSEEGLTGVALLVVQIFVIVGAGVIGFEYSTTVDAFGYNTFRDVSLMVFFGFGFWMSFLSNHGLTAIGFCLILSAVAVEMSLVVRYIVMDGTKQLSLLHVVGGLFCAAAVMVSFGAVLGKVNPFQLVLMTIIEVWVFWANYRLVFREIVSHDVGGGVYVFMFGAYFGLAATFPISWKLPMAHPEEKPSYSSDMFALLGTILLWVLWPSFTAAHADAAPRQMLAVSNTLLALSSSAIAFGLVSRVLNNHRFSVVDLQRATLAGGVAVGVIADADIGLHGPMLTGLVAGALSCVGFRFVDPLLRKIRVHDTCGVHNLFGMPGLMAGITGIIVTAIHGNGEAGKAGMGTTKGFLGINVDDQVYALLVSLGLAIGGGLFTGVLIHFPMKWLKIDVAHEDLFSDSRFFDASKAEVHL